MYEPPCNDDPAARQAWRRYLEQLTEALAAGRHGDAVAPGHRLRREPRPGRSTGVRQQDFWPAMAALGPALAYDRAGQTPLTLDTLEIPAFRQIVAMPPLTLPVVGVAYNVNASLGHDGISWCGRGPGRPARPTGPAGRSAPPARQPVAGRPWLIACVSGRNVIVTVTGVPGQPVTRSPVAATAAGPAVQALDTLPSTAPGLMTSAFFRYRRRCRGGSPRRKSRRRARWAGRRFGARWARRRRS